METGRGKRIATVSVAVGLAVVIAGGLTFRSRILEEYWLYRLDHDLRVSPLFEALGRNAQGYPEFRHRQTAIVMVLLPVGRFWMGAQKEDPNGPNYDPEASSLSGPVHEVTLSPFLIAKYEVSQVEWEKVMGSSPSYFKGRDLPVESVSWRDCQEFCRKTGFKLPTEAQWEYACRARTSGVYAGAGRLDEMGWYVDNSELKTHPVGQKQPNGFGLYDLHGNVYEACEDVCDEEFYAKPEARWRDPLCTSDMSDSSNRVRRGGCWESHASTCGSSRRNGDVGTNVNVYLGFRPVYPLP